MKKPILVLVLGVLALGAVLALVMQSRTSPKEAAPDLMVYFTCDTSGRIEPCGCFTGQLGGLTRVDTWLQQNRQADSLLVDVGGAIGGPEDYHLIQYKYILDAYHRMGFHALNLGAAEARLSADELRKVAGSSSVPIVSASLVDTTTREPLGQPAVVVEVAARKVGLLGVVDPASVGAPGSGVGVLSLDDAITRHLPDLVARCDTVVLLAFASEVELQRLAREYYEFPLILGGDVKQSSQTVQRENSSTILFTTNQARTVGQVKLRGPEHEPSEFDIHMLRPYIEQSAEIARLADHFRKEIKNTVLAIDDPEALTANSIPGVAPVATYTGSQSCQQCHPREFEIWQRTGHSHAFQSLTRRESDADPTCIGCHTVGFGTASGYRRSYQDQKLTDVGCESCHGPGSEHVSSRRAGTEATFKFRPLGAGDCLACHHGEFSRPFEWEQFWPRIRHGKDQTPIR